MGTFGTPSSYNNTGALGSATNPTTAQGLSRDRENQKAILELPGTQAWVEKTITDGVIIPTSAEVIVLPEGGASTDSLTTITLTSDGTTTLHEGMTIRLKAANSNTITVVHGAGTNNISTIGGNSVVLDTTWYLELKLINGLWVQQETSAYKTANEAKITVLARTAPATTTSRGIGRVATLADMGPGAEGTNGPAVIDAKGGVITPTPTAHAVPQADANGRIHVGFIPGIFVGDIRLLPFHPDDLAAHCPGWYFCNGDQYSLTSDVGIALNGLQKSFKTAWGIVITGGNIGVPNLFYSNGCGYFLRAVDGTARTVGGIEQDTFQGHRHDGSFASSTKTKGGEGTAMNNTYATAIVGDPTTDTVNGTPRISKETRPINVGMTPAIFLDV